jgi:hypothetical protein
MAVSMKMAVCWVLAPFRLGLSLPVFEKSVLPPSTGLSSP